MEIEDGTMSNPSTAYDSRSPNKAMPPDEISNRVSVPEIARRLNVGRLAVYAMLEQGLLPGIRLGRRWIITRHAYELLERSCGTRSGAGFPVTEEVRVVN